MSDLFEAVQPIFVTVWKFEHVQVLQRASVILRCHPGDLLQNLVQLLLTGRLKRRSEQDHLGNYLMSSTNLFNGLRGRTMKTCARERLNHQVK